MADLKPCECPENEALNCQMLDSCRVSFTHPAPVQADQFRDATKMMQAEKSLEVVAEVVAEKHWNEAADCYYLTGKKTVARHNALQQLAIGTKLTDHAKATKCIADLERMLKYYSEYANVCADEALVYQKTIRELRAQLAEAKEDAARLDFVLDNFAFIVKSKTDAGGAALELMTQNEDEEYITLSGEGKFFKTARDAIDAARNQNKGEG